MITRLLTFYPGRLDLAKGAMTSIYGLRDGAGRLEQSWLVFFNPQATVEARCQLSHRITIVELPQHGGATRGVLRRLSFARAVWRLARVSLGLARSSRAQAIIALDPHLLGLLAWRLAARLRVPWAIEVVQDYDVSARRAHRLAFKPFLLPSVERAVERLLFRRAPLVLAMYPHLARWAVERGADPAKVLTIGTVADPCHFATARGARDERDLVIPAAKGRTWLLYVGRLHPVKYTQDLPAIVEAAVRHGIDAHLVVAGDGPQREELERAMAERGLPGRFTVLGMQSQAALARLYRMADVTIYTHGGITLVEGALAGTPIVAYRHDWHADLVGDDERGLLVPFRDTEAFGRAIAAAVADPAAAAERAERARDFARTNFSYERYAEIQGEVLRRLAAARS